jgi:hypothetical protein
MCEETSHQAVCVAVLCEIADGVAGQTVPYLLQCDDNIAAPTEGFVAEE